MTAADLVCFSHLRWDFVFQRPQHLLTRAARTMRVLYWEEPEWRETGLARVEERTTPEGVVVATPHLPWGCDYAGTLRLLLDEMLSRLGILRPVLWYYTPHALEFSAHLVGDPVIYDCMDELSAFAGADPALPELEAALMARASLVFTGGYSLFEAKRARHSAVHAFPSGVDVAHFRPARCPLPEPSAAQAIPRPRAGFYGVLDERLDRQLLGAVASLRPGVQFVLVGPLAKLDEAELPQAANLHYLGPAPYAELPNHLAHWDVALMPFAINAATRFISPTKTPEYLAAGRPVVSTRIVDVARQYGGLAGVQIASDAAGFAAAIDRALALAPEAWRAEADRMVDGMSWDRTWARMAELMAGAGARRVAAA